MEMQGTDQFAVFIHRCDVNLRVNEELLEIIPMLDTTTGLMLFLTYLCKL